MNIIIQNQAESANPSFYCVKDLKSPGFAAKKKWFSQENNRNLQLLTAVDDQGKAIGFIEYTTAENAWRPVIAPDYLFIHCIAVISKENRNQSVGSSLIQTCLEEAREQNKAGVCVSASKGVWMADPSLFLKNGFAQSDAKGRFQLMYFCLRPDAPLPSYPDWDSKLKEFKGWHLLYSDQCPWHVKSVSDLSKAAEEAGVTLKITLINSPEQAQNAPMGYGTFGLIKDGILLEDHYLSRTRFETLLRKFGNLII